MLNLQKINTDEKSILNTRPSRVTVPIHKDILYDVTYADDHESF